MPRWMINCKEYSELVSNGLDRPLTFWNKVSLGIHKLICPPCKHVRAQFNMIRKACQWTPPEDVETGDKHIQLPQDARDSIKSALKKAAQEDQA